MFCVNCKTIMRFAGGWACVRRTLSLGKLIHIFLWCIQIRFFAKWFRKWVCIWVSCNRIIRINKKKNQKNTEKNGKNHSCEKNDDFGWFHFECIWCNRSCVCVCDTAKCNKMLVILRKQKRNIWNANQQSCDDGMSSVQFRFP